MGRVTLTQLGAFVLVARLGSVKAAAAALGVSEPAVSQALSALRQHLGDPLLVRDGSSGMTPTAGGRRLLTIASQMVTLGAEAEDAVRAARGAPEQLRLVSSSTIAEFVAAPLVEAFTRRFANGVEATFGVATGEQMPVLVANRLADMAVGPYLGADPSLGLTSEPIFRCQMVVVTSARSSPRGAPGRWTWLVDPSGPDPDSTTGRLLRRLGVTEDRVRVFPNQTAAWAAVADGTDGAVAPAIAHLIAPRLQRGELTVVPTPATPAPLSWHATTLRPDRRSVATGSFRRFLGTPEALHLMRSPGTGVPPSRFRPPVYVTIWS
jgi:LysR family transcriptional regulator, low CO2-responsive transcriptional regulator